MIGFASFAIHVIKHVIFFLQWCLALPAIFHEFMGAIRIIYQYFG